jgi:hypothetical protein
MESEEVKGEQARPFGSLDGTIGPDRARARAVIVKL